MSEKFLILRAFFTSLRLIFELYFLNSIYLLLAAIFKLHLKKNLTSDFGKIFVEISLPSIQQFLYFLEKFTWYLFKICLILFIFAILALYSEILG